MQHLVVVTAILYVGMLAAVFSRVRVRPQKSISYHIAQTAGTIQLARWVMVAIHVLLLLWLLGWAAGALQLRWDFIAAFSLACVFGALSGIVPYTGTEEQMRLHDAFAWMYAVLIVMLDAMLVVQTTHAVTKVVLLAFTAIQGFIFFTFFSYRPSRKYFLYTQVLFMSLFSVALVLTTYIQ
jgi:hypothetical protein